ncbi:arginine repressor [Agathobacter rectalis ATCC 33656]|uniref:Arginine repressor n=2 Tax=Agathobacter rectalis TaxID=39491 RepID=C4ZCY3_AGARV|nr:arginine repressor [Agathobacter rectalis ATCC 33656]
MRWQDMKTNRQSKIIEIIQKNEVETQDELSALLEKDGFCVTQATVSRDIRELKLTKIPTAGGRQKYAVITDAPENLSKKYERVLREGFLSMDMAQNILVIKTVSGMASAVCAAIDAMKMREIVGSIAGDDTIMCAIRTVDDTYAVMKKIRRIVE